jgi:TRAP-type transport system periplasmic protein
MIRGASRAAGERRPLVSRRRFLKASVLLGAGAVGGLVTPAAAADGQRSPSRPARPIRIVMGGYSPPSTGFSLALKQIGDRLEAKFPGEVEVKYVYNILDLGYRAEDILWLVEEGLLTLGYQSSSYLTDRVPDLGIADLPFLFPDGRTARASMDGRLGELLTSRIEAGMNYRILGWLENGFRHISNRLRPIHLPADVKGMVIRVLPSKVQVRTFELLGAIPKVMDLSEAIAAVKAGTLDAQENPFANTVTYGIHNCHKDHSATNHFYLSRPIFLHRQSYDGWPRAVQEELRAAVHDAVALQRTGHVKEEEEAMVAIRAAGGTIIELTPEEHQAFVTAVTPIYGEARGEYGQELLKLVNL